MKILAIDPGTTESAWVEVAFDPDGGDGSLRVLSFGKEPNADVLSSVRAKAIPLEGGVDIFVIEDISSYGKIVSTDVFETLKMIGRVIEAVEFRGRDIDVVTRRDVKVHHTATPSSNDTAVCIALRERFARGFSNHGKGTKSNPSIFYGFFKDVWQAFALASKIIDDHQIKPRSCPTT